MHQVARDIGYMPDRAAQRLKTGRTNVISILLDPHEEVVGFGTSIMYGITKALQKTPYHLIVMPNYLATSNVEAVDYILRNNLADGLIFSRTEPLDPRVRRLLEHGFPSSATGAPNSRCRIPSVDYDNFAFAYEATRRMIAKGRRKVTIILPPKRLTFHQHMLHGFMTAVREAGIAYEIPENINLDSPADMVRDHFRPPGRSIGCARWFHLSRRGFRPRRHQRLERSRANLEQELRYRCQADLAAASAEIQPKVDTIYEDLTAAGEQLGRILLKRIANPEADDLQLLQPPKSASPQRRRLISRPPRRCSDVPFAPKPPSIRPSTRHPPAGTSADMHVEGFGLGIIFHRMSAELAPES